MEIGEHILQVVLALGLVVGLVFALGYVMKRINSGGFREGGEIRVVASTFLGPKERLLLVQVRDRQILLGVNPQSIRSLGEFDGVEPAGSEGFDKVLREARGT
ncbi:MAG: flagellar biosynthetic protein FliO [Pseudomonadales bacterium]